MHLRVLARASSGEHELEAADLFSHNEQEVFTKALELAEARGKSVHLAVAPATEKWDGILRAAQGLQSSTIALGLSTWRAPVEEARVAGEAWSDCPSQDRTSSWKSTLRAARNMRFTWARTRRV
jgi:hypothetical protein